MAELKDELDFTAPMLEEAMNALDGGAERYPKLTFQALKKAKAGERILVTVAIKDKDYCLPGTFCPDEGEGNFVELDEINWELLGCEPIKQVPITKDTILRGVGARKRKGDLELGVETVNSLYAGKIADALTLADNETNKRDYAQSIVDTIYRDTKSFKAKLDSTKNKYAHLAPLAEKKEGNIWPRGEFFVQALIRFMESFTLNEWLALGATDRSSEEFILKTQTNIFTPTLAAMTSKETEKDEVTAFKMAMGNSKPKENTQSLVELMDEAVHFMTRLEDDVEKEPKAADEKEVGKKKPKVTGDIGTLWLAMQEMMIQNAKLTQAVQSLETKFGGRLEQVATQLHIKNSAPADGWTATRIKVDPDHNCGYNVLQALFDKATDPASVLNMSTKKAKEAKETILLEARRQWLADPKEFFNTTLCKHDAYVARMVDKPRTENWCEAREMGFFTAANPTLEIRSVYKDPKGMVQVTSTMSKGDPPRAHVGFALFTEYGEESPHHDIGAIRVHGDNNNTELKYIFTAAEADRAQQLLCFYLTNEGKKVKKKAPNVVPMEKQSDEEYRAELAKMMKDADDGDDEEGEGWKTVANQNRKQIQRKKQEASNKKKAEEEDKKKQTAENTRQAAIAARQLQAQELLLQQQQQMVIAQQQATQQVAWAQPLQPPPAQWPAQQSTQWPTPAQAQPRSQYTPSLSVHQPPPPPQQQQLSTPSVHQPLPQQSPTPVQQPAPARSTWNTGGNRISTGWGKQPTAGGESVVPSVVVFGSGKKKDLKSLLHELSPIAAVAVTSIAERQGTFGTPRMILHCKQQHLTLVQSLVPLLLEKGHRADTFDPNPPRKSQAAVNGVEQASTNAGICRQFAAQVHCPHAAAGNCKFACWPRKGAPSQP
jgi:hypothetical protein